MKPLFVIGLPIAFGGLILSFFNLVSAAEPPPTGTSPTRRPTRQYPIEDFMDTIRITGASFSPDESLVLVSSDQTGIPNVFSVAVADETQMPLTHSTNDSTFAVSYFPKDRRVLFTRDQGGNEENHLYVRESDGSEKDVTPGAKFKAEFGGWTRDDQGFYLQTNERDKRYFDLYRVNTSDYSHKLLYENSAGYSIAGISDNEQWIALVKPTTTADSDIYLFNCASGEIKHISPHKGNARYQPAAFDHANRFLYYLTDDGSEFMRVRRYQFSSGQHEEVERADWDVLFTEFSHDGKYRVSAINEDGRTLLRVYDESTGTVVPLPRLPDGEINSVEIARSEKRVAFYLNGDRSPGDLFIYDFETKQVQRLTHTLSKKIDPLDLVDSSVVRFKSFDGLEIPNILYKPYQAAPDRKAPTLVYVHGGPGGQTRPGYNPNLQYLVNHGYVVLCINNRGSSGYGKTFFTADDRKHGREPLWDCVEAKKYLADLPYVDPDRIGIIGGSYGGYMTLAALAFKPDVFKCGVDIFGVANWLRTLESTPPWWESMKKALYEEMGDPVKDREMLMAISPLFHADQIRKPLLVIQGANDPRVLKIESDEMVAAVRKSGVPVEYVVFPDEGHGFTKKKNRLASARATLEFLDKYLVNEGR